MTDTQHVKSMGSNAQAMTLPLAVLSLLVLMEAGVPLFGQGTQILAIPSGTMTTISQNTATFRAICLEHGMDPPSGGAYDWDIGSIQIEGIAEEYGPTSPGVTAKGSYPDPSQFYVSFRIPGNIPDGATVTMKTTSILNDAARRMEGAYELKELQTRVDTLRTSLGITMSPPKETTTYKKWWEAVSFGVMQGACWGNPKMFPHTPPSPLTSPYVYKKIQQIAGGRVKCMVLGDDLPRTDPEVVTVSPGILEGRYYTVLDDGITLRVHGEDRQLRLDDLEREDYLPQRLFFDVSDIADAELVGMIARTIYDQVRTKPCDLCVITERDGYIPRVIMSNQPVGTIEWRLDTDSLKDLQEEEKIKKFFGELDTSYTSGQGSQTTFYMAENSPEFYSRCKTVFTSQRNRYLIPCMCDDEGRAVLSPVREAIKTGSIQGSTCILDSPDFSAMLFMMEHLSRRKTEEKVCQMARDKVLSWARAEVLNCLDNALAKEDSEAILQKLQEDFPVMYKWYCIGERLDCARLNRMRNRLRDLIIVPFVKNSSRRSDHSCTLQVAYVVPLLRDAHEEWTSYPGLGSVAGFPPVRSCWMQQAIVF